MRHGQRAMRVRGSQESGAPGEIPFDGDGVKIAVAVGKIARSARRS
jgi:hypothetical protein